MDWGDGLNTHDLGKPGDSLGRSRLLLVDDNLENLKLLERMLEWAGFANVISRSNSREAFERLAEIRPDLIVLDLKMPGMDGYEFLRRMRDEAPLHSFVPILVFTCDLSPDAKSKALELGASDFLTKPGDAIEIQLRVRNFLRMRMMQAELHDQNVALEAKVRHRTEHLNVARLEAIEVLANTCEYRDDETGRHARRVGDLSAGIAKAMGLDSEFVEAIQYASSLHDLGKVAIPDSILFKTGALTPEEYEVMRRHAAIGADLIGDRTSPLLQLAREIARFHHERWDGAGYEQGLAGEEIPLSARIVAVADAFDAMTHDRPYRTGRSRFEAMEEIQACAGSQFDSRVVDAFARYLSQESFTDGHAA